MSAHLRTNATLGRVFIPIGEPAKPRPQRVKPGQRRTGKSAAKRTFVAAARQPWKGKSYRKAKRFARKLERERVAGGAQ